MVDSTTGNQSLSLLLAFVASIGLLLFDEPISRAHLIVLGNADEWTNQHETGVDAYKMGDYQDARNHWKNALEQAESSENASQISTSLESLAQASAALKDADATLGYYERLLRTARGDLGTQELVGLLSTAAKEYEKLGLYEDALALLFEAYGRESTFWKGGIPVAQRHLDLARHFRLRKNYQRAERHYLRAIEALSDPPAGAPLEWAIEDYAELLTEMGRHDEAERQISELRRLQSKKDVLE
jgi:tetratricopeptide (TPR) repeat protein